MFVLKGEKGLFSYLDKVLENRGHAVVCLAEGAGQVIERSSACSGLTLCR
jgi:hypothetical protein